MFWRHPHGAASGSNWPRCSATLRGEVHDLGKIVGEAKTYKWLHCKEVMQPGTSGLVKVDPERCWMPFEIQRFVLVEETAEQ